MDLLLDEFTKDLARLKKLQTLLGLLNGFRVHPKPAVGSPGFIDHAISLHDSITTSHPDLLVLSGAIILYLGGRFEFYVRERFEQACDAIAAKCANIDQLPKPMKEKLILMTAEVMAAPRKYGHAEKGVESFVKQLAQNMSQTAGLANINRQCISITTDNMRPDMLADLFARIGMKDIWKTIAEQACIRTYFGQQQVDLAQKSCRTVLNEFMDSRNKIAHPSANVELS